MGLPPPPPPPPGLPHPPPPPRCHPRSGADADQARRNQLLRHPPFFIPSLLLGVYHRPKGDPCTLLAFAPAAAASLPLVPPPPPADVDSHGSGACVFGPYQPLSSRRLLVVLCRRCKIVSYQGRCHCHGNTRCGVELAVCHPASGERWVVPSHKVLDQSLVLLDVNQAAARGGTTRSSFKLLAAHLPETSPRTLTVQLFSSDEDGWGPPLPCIIPHDCELHSYAKPVVLRGVVHWLCLTYSHHRILVLKWQKPRRGRRDVAQPPPPPPPKASLMRLPTPCQSGVHDMCLALSLATNDDGTASRRTRAAASLSVLVLVGNRITVWMRATAVRRGRSVAIWERRHAIREESIARAAVGSRLHDGWLRKTRLGWFCEGSGALVLEVEGDDDGGGRPLLLDMGSMAVKKVEMISRRPEFCHYEVDLISYMLFVMKTF